MFGRDRFVCIIYECTFEILFFQTEVKLCVKITMHNYHKILKYNKRILKRIVIKYNNLTYLFKKYIYYRIILYYRIYNYRTGGIFFKKLRGMDSATKTDNIYI